MNINEFDKKELTRIKNVLIKLSKIFESCAILNTGCVVSPCELEFVYIELKNEYISILQPFFERKDGTNSSPMIYIPSIKDLKTVVQELIDKPEGVTSDVYTQYQCVSNGSELYERSIKMMDDYRSHINNLNYSRLSYDDEKLSILFDANMTFDTPIELDGKQLHITTGKCMFPYCNKSNFNKCMYSDTILYFKSVRSDYIYQFNLYCDLPEMNVYTAYRFI